MIFVSAGHHPARPGACFDGYCEHEEALIWTSLIVNHLGMRAMVVPPGILREKVAFINERAKRKDMAIEIHFNSAVNSDGHYVGRGCETLYTPSDSVSEHWAGIVQRGLVPFFKPDRGIHEGWYRRDPTKGILFFLAQCRCTALIIEPYFLYRKEQTNEYRDEGCKTIAAGLWSFGED